MIKSLSSDYEKSLFTIDGEHTYVGYHIPENRWNGWAIPVFEVSVAMEIMKIVNSELSEHYKVTRDDAGKCFKVLEKDYGTTSRLEDFSITVNGEQLIVVDFMGSNWTWDDRA